jgi:hypothetical protein
LRGFELLVGKHTERLIIRSAKQLLDEEEETGASAE